MIGNSFSEDAHHYLSRIAEGAGQTQHKFLNAYIGGCSLERHVKCIEGNLCEYGIMYNDKNYCPDLLVTLRAAIAWQDWDVISVQQVSGDSGVYETYHPYIDRVVDFVRENAPNAKLVIHQTWAYEANSNHFAFPQYDCDYRVMHSRLTDCYERMVDEMGAVGMVPSGNVINALRQNPEFDITKGGVSLFRDGYHLSQNYGRYAAAAAWFTALGLGDIDSSDFVPPVEGIDPKLLAIVKKTVKEIVKPIL